jgi:phosphate transport system permease protein
MSSYRTRKLVDRLGRGLCSAALLAALLPLGLVLGYLLVKGVPGLNLAFFTELPKPVGEPNGGMANALVGSLLLVLLAAAGAVPVGVLGGVYLAEFGDRPFGRVVRFSADVLAGIPSIAVGVFVYASLVLTMKRFSMLAGAVALAILMLPTLMRTTEEILKMVPPSLREAGLALGLPRWRVTLGVLLRTGGSGVATGILLAVARALGETAPLLFTAFGSRFWSLQVDQPVASLPVQIYTYAVSPYAEWHRQAWAAALALVLFVLVLNVLARTILKPAEPGR